MFDHSTSIATVPPHLTSFDHSTAIATVPPHLTTFDHSPCKQGELEETQNLTAPYLSPCKQGEPEGVQSQKQKTKTQKPNFRNSKKSNILGSFP